MPFIFFLLYLVSFCSLGGKELTSLEKAIRNAFPAADSFKRKTIYLTRQQVQSFQKIVDSNIKIESRLLVCYLALKKKSIIGYSYLDTHRVRSLSETVLISIDPEGNIHRIEVLNFNEPIEYKAPSKWLKQFWGKSSEDKLRIGKDIHGITGASLTANALANASKRILVLHKMLVQKNKK